MRKQIPVAEYLLGDGEVTCIFQMESVSHDGGFLACSYSENATEEICTYWYEEIDTITDSQGNFRITICPLTRRQQFKYILIRDIPDNIRNTLFQDDNGTTLKTNNKTLNTLLNNQELNWQAPEAQQGRIIQPSDSSRPEPLRSLLEEILQHFLSADTALRLRLLKKIMHQLIEYILYCPGRLLVIITVGLLSVLFTLTGLTTGTLGIFILGGFFCGLNLVVLLEAIAKASVLILGITLYVPSLPFSFIADTVKVIVNLIHHTVRTHHARGLENISIDAQQLNAEMINNIVNHYHQQFRKRHPTLIGRCSLGLFATQQSRSSANLIKVLQNNSAQYTLDQQRNEIRDYLAAEKNIGKSLWKSIITQTQANIQGNNPAVL